MGGDPLALRFSRICFYYSIWFTQYIRIKTAPTVDSAYSYNAAERAKEEDMEDSRRTIIKKEECRRVGNGKNGAEKEKRTGGIERKVCLFSHEILDLLLAQWVLGVVYSVSGRIVKRRIWLNLKVQNNVPVNSTKFSNISIQLDLQDHQGLTEMMSLHRL